LENNSEVEENVAIPDPLLDINGGGLRVAYSTGRMLNTEDFQAEQLYHRGRLAHAVQWLHGPGTVNGLNVTAQDSSAGEKELQISPGLAVDRAGRLVEVFFPLCIRLKTWLDAQSASDLSDAFKTADNAIVADLFMGYEQDEQGKTPSFASGDYDNTDAFNANRFLDSFSARLFLRAEATPPLPADPWAAAFTGATIDLNAIKNALLHGQSGPAQPPGEYPLGVDPTTVFLARIKVPATRATPGVKPVFDLNANPAVIDNLSRQFVYPTSLLAQWLSKK
jgi:hypothetical protein